MLMNIICCLSLYQQTLQMCQRDVFMARRGGRDGDGIDEEARAETGDEIKTV